MTASRPLPIIALLATVLVGGIATMKINDPATHVNGNKSGPVASGGIDRETSAIPTITVIRKRTADVEQHALTTADRRA